MDKIKVKQVKIARKYTNFSFDRLLLSLLFVPFTLGISLLFAFNHKDVYDFVIIYEDDSREMLKNIKDKKVIEELLMYI